eukprot:5484500-Amphidinium_carterae.1
MQGRPAIRGCRIEPDSISKECHLYTQLERNEFHPNIKPVCSAGFDGCWRVQAKALSYRRSRHPVTGGEGCKR